MTKRKNETREEYLERCRIWEKEHRPNRWKERREHQMYCCESLENVENYEKAKADNFEGWHLHHRLETHTSDGKKRLVDISMKELKALGMYWHRPANELLFIKATEHIKLHNTGKKGLKCSDETKKKIAESNRNNPKLHCKKVRCIETNTVYPSIGEAERVNGIHHGDISSVCHGKRLTAGGYHWELV